MKYGTSMMVVCGMLLTAALASGATTQKRYYAHEAVEDSHGVIAPWYKGQNGQFDERVRIAAETLKRYPWTDTKKAPAALPEYVFSGSWKIAPDGTITIPMINDWANGDLGQRASYVLSSLVDYYRYSGDPAAIAHLTLQADALLDYCLTPEDHPWPKFLISVPVKGKPYGQADPQGFIQLEIVAEVGLPLIKAAQITGNQRWFEAAKHWGDLLAAKRNRQPGISPWSRYANPQDVPWEDIATGGVTFILDFFDALIRAGYTGKDNEIVKAREQGVAFLRDVMLPNWTGGDTWGRNFWDWPCQVQVENVTEFAARYVMAHPDEFPNWRSDTRNIATLFLNRTSVDPRSNADVFSGAWAHPESSGCCGRSLWYGPMELANVYAQYGAVAGSEWARELARRQLMLCTYDFHETGVVEDNIDGGFIVAADWFKIAHPMALKHVLAAMAWMPEVFGPSRENHIMRSSSVVTQVVYGDGNIAYSTYDAPADTVDVVRLAFQPASVTADGAALAPSADGKQTGYQTLRLPDGDCIVTIRHDGKKNIVISGDDPQEVVPAEPGGDVAFAGNQVRIIGNVGPEGGLAEVYVDGVKQPAGIDCWAPAERKQQVLYYKNGLPNDPHKIKVVAAKAKNPVSKGTGVYINAVQFSAATPKVSRLTWGEGGGPDETQRMIMGYAGRQDYVDSAGNTWRPGTEFVIRLGPVVDSVAASWWTQRTQLDVGGTQDPELYRHGVHGKEFWVDFTVAPGTYHARLKFAETRNIEPKLRAFNLAINGREVVTNLDIAATVREQMKLAEETRSLKVYTLTHGLRHAVDLVFNELKPANGVISIRFKGSLGGEAIVQAIEVGPGDGGRGAKPVAFVAPAPPPPKPAGENLLRNGGFEAGSLVPGEQGAMGKTVNRQGWTYVFAGPSVSYLWGESAYSAHPDWGMPVYHSGKQALRTHTNGHGHTIVYQDVEVAPETKYMASVWVRADDLHGRGFGRDSSDSAGLWIQEMDQAESIVVDHHKQAITKAGDYRQLSFAFTTAKTTTKVRFILDTAIACPYDQGHVTYDDSALVAAKPSE